MEAKCWDVCLNRKIAKINLHQETKKIEGVNFYLSSLRFRCVRCATFCCKLGGPALLAKDIERIKKMGYAIEDFLDSVSRGGLKALRIVRRSLKSREDGSCIFLRFDAPREVYECSIYDFRPALCRIYPLDFERINSNSLVLRLIPCCRGINSKHGDLIDEEFIITHFLDAMLDLMNEP